MTKKQKVQFVISSDSEDSFEKSSDEDGVEKPILQDKQQQQQRVLLHLQDDEDLIIESHNNAPDEEAHDVARDEVHDDEKDDDVVHKDQSKEIEQIVCSSDSDFETTENAMFLK